MRSAPASLTASTSSPKRAKSAERMDGATRTDRALRFAMAPNYVRDSRRAHKAEHGAAKSPVLLGSAASRPFPRNAAFTAGQPLSFPSWKDVPVHRISVLRFILALMVVVQHIGGLLIGTVAVEAFFAISGFLVTMIATTTYQGRPFAYLANRALRIFPVYWACLAIGALVLWFVPDVHLSVALRWPDTTVQAISQITIFGLPMTDEYPKILPPAWSLHTELWLYLVIGLVTAHSPRLTLLLVPASTAI